MKRWEGRKGERRDKKKSNEGIDDLKRREGKERKRRDKKWSEGIDDLKMVKVWKGER